MEKKFLVIGLGRFGKSVIQELHHQGCSVIAVDLKESNLQEVKDFADITILGNAKNNQLLDELDIPSFQSVFVSIGEAADAAIYITKKLKDRLAKEIVAKASDHETGEILEAVGADIVIIPEEESGKRAAKQIVSKGILEHFSFNGKVSGVEIEVPSDFFGKSLSDLNFTKKFGLTVALLIRNNEPFLNHFAFEPLQQQDRFLIIGDDRKIKRFQQKFL